ncbi:hypothetical protein JTE90_020250 [Oedothorax gibbosus]|uniref:Uncharacterized protein n=1 Tax=Oedothorax gibbosus TaxID=931172 RepID=A0AAV6TCU4_9ARAC|nr:hypothetical protein JTE90_020250 [Oedothorax gibbosus]
MSKKLNIIKLSVNKPPRELTNDPDVNGNYHAHACNAPEPEWLATNPTPWNRHSCPHVADHGVYCGVCPSPFQFLDLLNDLEFLDHR